MNAEQYIESISANVDEYLRSYFQAMSAFHASKHWYQMGETILTMLREDSLYSQNISLIEFYKNYIATFESKLLESTLADIACMISDSMSDPNEALSFLVSVFEKVGKNKEAKQKCLVSQGFVYLRIGVLEKVKEIVDSVGDDLDIFSGFSQLHGIYFKLSAEYHKKMSNHTKYYHMQLNFMSCAPPAVLFGQKFLQSVIDITRSAILSPDIINMQEWLQHRAVNVLIGTEVGWMKALMSCITDGDLNSFGFIGPTWISRDDEFARNSAIIRQKLSLNALARMRFRENAIKFFSFNDIARETGVEYSGVEALVMRAFAKNVIRGYIDQVKEQVYIEWTYPRICSNSEIANMKDKIFEWANSLRDLANTLEESASPILQPFF